MENIVFIRFHGNYGKVKHPSEIVWPISAGIAATILKNEGFNVKIIDMQTGMYSDFQSVQECITRIGANIIFFQYETPSFNIALGFSKSIKENNKDLLMIAFGQHASFFPKEIIRERGADICVTTDLEFIVRDLICAINKGCLDNIRNIVYIARNVC